MTKSSPRPWGITVAAGMAISTMVAALPLSLVHASPGRLATAQTVAAVEKSQTGKLHVKVYGLPKGSKAKVQVSGPGAFTKKVPKTATLAGLKPGTYRVSASQVSVNGKKYKAAVKPKAKVAVKKNKVAKVRVRHVPLKPPSSSSAPATPPAPDSSSPPPASSALKFNLADAAGVAVPEKMSTARVERSAATAGGAPLLSVAADGQMTNALAEGEVPAGMHVAATFPGPRKKLAIAYGGYPTGPWSDPSSLCRLGLIDRKTGEHTCLENMAGPAIDATHGQGAMNGYANVQFDALGRVYYRGSEYVNGQTKYIIRRHDGDRATDLINYGNVFLEGWIVASDGTVVVSGMTVSTNQHWTRAISPSGSIQGLPYGSEPLPAQFPDGNVYLQQNDNASGMYGIRRFLVGSGQLEDKFWMAPATSANKVIWDTSQFCAIDHTVYCGGGYTRSIVTTRASEVWAISYGKALRLYPSPTVADLALTPTVITAVGNRVAVSGTDAAGNQTTVLYNPTNGATKTLLGPTNQVEVFSLNHASSSGLIMFDGVRYSDGKYVVGVIDPVSGAVSMDAATKMSQVVTFDE